MQTPIYIISKKYQFYSVFTYINSAIFRAIEAGLFITFGHNTKSPFTFFSASAGAASNYQASALTLIASGAAAAFIRCCSIIFKGAHGLVVPPRHVSFLLQEKKNKELRI